MTKPAATKIIDEQATRGIEAIQQIVTERDRLQVENERMRVDLMMERTKSEQTQRLLETANAERDHYMRYSTEITTKLTDIQVLISQTVDAAKHAAYLPPKVPPPRVATVDDINAGSLEKLIAKLPVNGGEKIA